MNAEIKNLDILETLQLLDISGCNGNFQSLVEEKILATGLAVASLRVGDLIVLINAAIKEYNA